jgi:DNA replication and repair protein RecF
LHVRHIRVRGYRNLVDQEILFAPGLNLLSGANGQGKTNVLESIFLLATLRSFRSKSLKDVIRHGERNAEVAGSVWSGDIPIDLRLSLNTRGRRLWVGKRSINGVSEYLGKLKVVAFTPDDLSMVKSGPSIRRRFLDRAVFLFHPEHLFNLKEFNTALKARNRLLKGERVPDRAVLESFTEQLANYGSLVTQERERFIEGIQPIASGILAGLEDGTKRLKLLFQAGWDTKQGKSSEHLLAQLNHSLDKDIRRRMTSVGPQQDDFEIKLGDESARRFASQGQQRSCTLSLLLAIVDRAVGNGGEAPVILLDDVSSELDEDRRKNLFERVMGFDSQVLITTTDKKLLKGLGHLVSRNFWVREGKMQETGE